MSSATIRAAPASTPDRFYRLSFGQAVAVATAAMRASCAPRSRGSPNARSCRATSPPGPAQAGAVLSFGGYDTRANDRFFKHQPEDPGFFAARHRAEGFRGGRRGRRSGAINEFFGSLEAESPLGLPEEIRHHRRSLRRFRLVLGAPTSPVWAASPRLTRLSRCARRWGVALLWDTSDRAPAVQFRGAGVDGRGATGPGAQLRHRGAVLTHAPGRRRPRRVLPSRGPAPAQEEGTRGEPLQSPVLIPEQDRLFAESQLGAAALGRIEDDARGAPRPRTGASRRSFSRRSARSPRKRARLTVEEFTARANAFDDKVQQLRAEQDAKARALARAREGSAGGLFSARSAGCCRTSPASAARW